VEKEARSPSHYEKDPSSSDGAAARNGVCERERERVLFVHIRPERERGGGGREDTRKPYSMLPACHTVR
jgi:hypothetical protein